MYNKKKRLVKKKKKIQHIYEEKCKHKHLPQHAPSRILHFLLVEFAGRGVPSLHSYSDWQ